MANVRPNQVTTPPQGAASRSAGTPIIRASGIRKAFRMGESRLSVLKDVNIAIQPGEFVAIEGRSGSGKSTLLHLLGALDMFDSGSISYEEHDYSRMTGAQRAQLRNTQFGFVFQFYHLLPELNVVENTMLSRMIELSWLSFFRRRSAIRKRACELLDQLGMSHRLDHYPNQLSGGERQRVAIARALMNSPRVLFADEPTGNLDTETGRQIMDLIEGLHRDHNQTIVMVTHDRTLAREADRVLLLKDGQIVKE